MASEPGALRGLYAVTPDCRDTETLVARVRLAIAGGARLVQYRAKALEPALALAQARRLHAECRAREALFIVNDSVELALAVAADGVHLGRDDGDVGEARKRLAHGVIGASCYSDPERARAAARAGADYVAVGSMFASSTKAGAPPAPLGAIALAHAASGLPVAAIGGITPANAVEVVRAGADMIAVISALFDARDVRAAALSLSRPFEFRESPHVRAQPRAV